MTNINNKNLIISKTMNKITHKLITNVVNYLKLQKVKTIMSRQEKPHKLHIGGGKNQFKGWINLDCEDYQQKFRNSEDSMLICEAQKLKNSIN